MKTNHSLLAAATAVALSASAAQANTLSGQINLSGTAAAECLQRWNMNVNPGTLVLDLATTAGQGFSSYTIKCNVGYTRTITSANAGKLVGPLPGYDIDYEFEIGGGGLTSTAGFQDLATPLVQSLPSTPGGGNQTGGITVRVKDTVVAGSKPAGVYADTVTIAIVPNP